VVLVEVEAREHLLVDVGHEHRLLQADRLRGGGVSCTEHRRLQLPCQRHLERVDVLERQSFQLAVDEDVDRAPVRDVGDGETGDVGERLLVVE
jgi:hypothetical protein